MIPKRLHHYWHDPDLNVGALNEACRQTWLDMHPDWEHYVWTDNNLPPLRNQTMYDHPQRWADQRRVNQTKSNVVRFEMLHKMGGVWVDWDVQCLRPIDRLLAKHEAFIGGRNGNLSTSVIGVEANHPWTEDMIRVLGNMPPVGFLNAISVVAANHTVELHPEVTVLGPDFFDPVPYTGPRTPNSQRAFAVNLWDHPALYTLEEL